VKKDESPKIIGVDGLDAFGQYLSELSYSGYRDYTFEMPAATGIFRECSLEEVLTRFMEFVEGKTNTFKVSISFVDYRHGTLGRTERIFTRRQPS
jgi:hypothetical protein